MLTEPLSKPKMLYLASELKPYGGATCVSAWTLQALAEHWDITILCSARPDFDGLNQHFGTQLDPSQFVCRRLPFPLNKLNRLDPDPFSIQRHAWLMRICRRMSRDFDVVVSCEDECDFGRPGIQYTHFPYMKRHLNAFRYAADLSPGEKIIGLLTGKFRPWMWISGIRLSGIQSNLMITNSQWTAQVLRDAYGVEPRVLYPPVRWEHGQPDWADRKNAFAVLGRLSPDKRILEMVEILERVRSRGFKVEMEIIGSEDAVAGKAYVAKILERTVRTAGWARLHQSISRDKLQDLVSGCRFGLHAMKDEHFGIAPAEMVRAGCIVFVHDSGGQVEIVGDQPGLRYCSDDDAVDKICAVLADETSQNGFRQALWRQASLFSESRFMCGMQEIVSEFAASKQNRMHAE